MKSITRLLPPSDPIFSEGWLIHSVTSAETPRKESEFAVRGDHITLGQLIKTLGVASSGADVKHFLQEYPTLVNGEPENRRGRKLRPGDQVDLPGIGPITLTPDQHSPRSPPTPTASA